MRETCDFLSINLAILKECNPETKGFRHLLNKKKFQSDILCMVGSLDGRSVLYGSKDGKVIRYKIPDSDKIFTDPKQTFQAIPDRGNFMQNSIASVQHWDCVTVFTCSGYFESN
jgi:hypothetical protein